jgi:hypothetical protein
MTVGQTFCFGAGALCLGVALAFALLTSLARQYSEMDAVEGCLNTVFVMLPLILGILLVARATLG